MSFVASMITVAAGLGGGILMIAALAAFYPPNVVVPIHAMVQLGSNAFRAMLLPRFIMWVYVPVFAAGAALGAAAASRVYVVLPTNAVQAMLALFILYLVWGKPIRLLAPSRPVFFGLGALGTAVSLFVGLTGPLIAPVVAVATPERRQVVATHAVMMGTMHVFKIAAFGFMGFAFGPYLGFIVMMMAAALLGTWAGRTILNRLPERVFRVALQATMTILALRMLWKAVV